MDVAGEKQADSEQAMVCRASVAQRGSWARMLVGAVLLGIIGTWLVWFSFLIQHKHHEEAIRAACQRVMPETVERCVDTVIIQRGGVRR